MITKKEMAENLVQAVVAVFGGLIVLAYVEPTLSDALSKAIENQKHKDPVPKKIRERLGA
jgi:hypothetical protein